MFCMPSIMDMTGYILNILLLSLPDAGQQYISFCVECTIINGIIRFASLLVLFLTHPAFSTLIVSQQINFIYYCNISIKDIRYLFVAVFILTQQYIYVNVLTQLLLTFNSNRKDLCQCLNLKHI